MVLAYRLTYNTIKEHIKYNILRRHLNMDWTWSKQLEMIIMKNLRKMQRKMRRDLSKNHQNHLNQK